MYCRYVAINIYIYDYLLAAWPSLTRRGQGSSRWVTWPDTFLDDDVDDLAGVVVVHDVLVWWQAGGRRRRCGIVVVIVDVAQHCRRG